MKNEALMRITLLQSIINSQSRMRNLHKRWMQLHEKWELGQETAADVLERDALDLRLSEETGEQKRLKALLTQIGG